MNIHAGDYVMLKSVDELRHTCNNWKAYSTYFAPAMLKAMTTSIPYRVAWEDVNKGCLFIDNDVYAFDKMCIKSVYKLVKVY